MAQEFKLNYTGLEINDKLQKIDCRDTVSKTFANVLTNSATGEIISLKDISPVEHDLGVRVSSKNLIPYPYIFTEKTYNGITLRVNDNGSVDVSGIATANNVPLNLTERFDITPYIGKTVSIPFLTADSSHPRLFVHLFYKDGTVKYNFMSSNKTSEVTKVIPNNAQAIQCGIDTMNTFNGETVTIYPQLELNTTATRYTPFISDISAVKLKILGKNLIDRNKITTEKGELTSDGNAQIFVSTKGGGNLYANLGNYKEFIGKKLTVSYTYVGCQSTAGRKSFYTYIQTDTGTVIVQKADLNSDGKTFEMSAVIPEDDTATNLIIRQYIGYVTNAVGDYVTISDFQVELNEKTEYEPYIEPIEYSINTDGTVNGVKSLYPSTTLTTDTVGALIEVDYNKDINKAFAELQQAIISLGGNL